MAHYAYELDGKVVIECAVKPRKTLPDGWVEVDPANLPDDKYSDILKIDGNQVIADPTRIAEADREARRMERRNRYMSDLPNNDDQRDAIWKALEALVAGDPVPQEVLDIIAARNQIKSEIAVD